MDFSFDYEKLKNNFTVKVIAIGIVVTIILSMLSKCGHQPSPNLANGPQQTSVVKVDTVRVEKIVKIPVYTPPQVITKIVTKREIKYDTIVSVLNKFIKDTVVQNSVTVTKYPNGNVIDSITYVGQIVQHKQTVDIKAKVDTIEIPVSTIITQTQTEVITKVKEVVVPKTQMYGGVTVAAYPGNVLSMQPQISVRFKKGLTVSMSKDLFCPSCMIINTSVPLVIKQQY